MNFYGVIVLIVVLGTASIALARYQHRHPASAAPVVQPAVGTTWFAALGINACGVQQAPLLANPNVPGGFHANPGGVIQASPATAASAGTNATLQRFVTAYIGLRVNAHVLAVPKGAGLSNPKTTWVTGHTCAPGTPDAGKKAQVEIAYWKNFASTTATITTDPSAVRFSQNMLISFVYAPDGTKPPKPPQSAIQAMLRSVPPVTTTTSSTIPLVTGSTPSPSTPTTSAPGG